MEDVYYCHALEILNHSFPSMEEMVAFSIQSAFANCSFGLHGFDKGWYLTTAQVSMLLST